MTSNNLLLNCLAKLMLEYQQHDLPVDFLFDDKQVGDFVKSMQIDSPYQQMLLEGVLTETVKDEKLYVSFTVEGYFHYVLGEVIYSKVTEKPSNYLLELIQSNQLNGIHEGVSNCLLRQVTNGVYTNLFDFIETSTFEEFILIKPLAVVFSEGDMNLFIENILKNDLDQNYALILKVLNYLHENNKYEVIDKFWKIFSTRIKQNELFNSSFHKAILQIKGLLHHSDQMQIEDIVQSISSENKLHFENCTLLEKQFIYIELNNVLVSKGLLKGAFEFSTSIGLYQFSEQLLSDNYYNILYPLLELGEFEQAEMIYQKCLHYNQYNGYFMNWSGWIYQAWYELKSNNTNHLENGIELYQMATGLIESDFGKYSIHKYQNLENLGYAYSLKGEYEKSCYYLDQAIMILQKSYQTDTTYLLGNPYEMKAVSLNSLGKYEEALQYSFMSDKCKLLQINEDSPEMAWNYYDKSKIYQNMGIKEEAKQSLYKALSIREVSLGKDNILTIQTKTEFEELCL